MNKEDLNLEVLEKQNKLFLFYKQLVGTSVINKIRLIFLLKYKYVYNFLAKKKLVPSDIKVKNFLGNTIKINVIDGNSSAIYYFGILGTEETGVTAYLLKNLKEDTIFYDVGASYGFYTVLALNFIKNGEIHSFEPSRNVVNFVKYNVEIQTRSNIFTKINNVAVSNSESDIDFYDNINCGHSLLSTTIKEKANFDTEKSGVSKYKVSSIALDAYTKDNKKPTLIKIDVEGAELNVLKGSVHLLENNQPELILEVRTDQKNIDVSLECSELLYSMRYKSFHITENGELTEIPMCQFSDYLENKSEIGFCNILFKK